MKLSYRYELARHLEIVRACDGNTRRLVATAGSQAHGRCASGSTEIPHRTSTGKMLTTQRYSIRNAGLRRFKRLNKISDNQDRASIVPVAFQLCAAFAAATRRFGKELSIWTECPRATVRMVLVLHETWACEGHFSMVCRTVPAVVRHIRLHRLKP